MKVKLKTLKGDAFDCQVTPNTAVGKVKELAVASDHGIKGGWQVDGVKLIFQGKVLDNDKDLISYNINDGDFMVVMVAKPKKVVASPAAAAAPSGAPTSSAAVAPNEDGVPALVAPVPSTPSAEPATSPTSATTAAPQETFSPQVQSAIDHLVEMGYSRTEVQAAMVAAFMNPDRAVQYLEEGIPTTGDGGNEVMQDELVPSTWADLFVLPSFRMELAAIRDQAQLQVYLQGLATSDPAKLALIQGNAQAFAQLLNEAQAASATVPLQSNPSATFPFGMAAPPGANAGAGGEGIGAAGLPPGMQQMIAQNPQMLEALVQNPEMLAQLMQLPEIQQAMQNPEVLEQLGIDPQQMQQALAAMGGGGMMGSGLGGGSGGVGVNPVLAQLNDEDESAIERLMALGFPRPIVIQAYIACEKNENLAANFLFDQGGDLM